MLKVLLIDDDDEILTLLTLGLQLFGFRVLTARAPHQALQVLEHERPECIVLDVDLGNWSGLAVLEALRQRTRTPVVMLSGNASDVLQERAILLGAQAYLLKPVGLRDLSTQIRLLVSASEDA